MERYLNNMTTAARLDTKHDWTAQQSSLTTLSHHFYTCCLTQFQKENWHYFRVPTRYSGWYPKGAPTEATDHVRKYILRLEKL